MGKDEEQTYDPEDRLLEYSVRIIKIVGFLFSFDVGRSMFDVHLFKQSCTA
jgi:hypothetical protein